MSIVRWLLFLWGYLAAFVMSYYAVSWATEPNNPIRNELVIGFGYGLVYGWPAWLGLPILVFVGRHQLGRALQLVLLSPIFLALVSFFFLGLVGGL